MVTLAFVWLALLIVELVWGASRWFETLGLAIWVVFILHFALELPNVPGTHGDHANTHYADPAPFLVRASIARAPERRHAIKPAL